MLLGLVATMAAACGPAAPEQVAADLPMDLTALTGSWTTTITHEEVWQGRWELHVQGRVALLRGPDRRFVVPGLVEAAGRGVVVFGRDEACAEQRREVGPGSYIYEVVGDELRFRADGDDTCIDRATVLTDAPWERILADPALPARVDAPADPECAALEDGGADGALPTTWVLDNRTTGMVVVLARTSGGDRSLLAHALAGEVVEVTPRRGGVWFVADLTGRCLAMVGDASKVTVRAGAAPLFERGRGADD